MYVCGKHSLAYFASFVFCLLAYVPTFILLVHTCVHDISIYDKAVTLAI
jgi:hypothetical protein